MSLLRRWFRGGTPARPARRRNKLRPDVEGLETRVVLYSASGNAWPNPQLITISFMPDGTQLGGNYTSNLFSTFNSNSNLDGKWQNVILQAAQTWAQQTNINFAVVPDDGAPQGSGPDEQGDPGFGDIRIGGFNFGSSTLALTYQPPQVNNFSIAGDVAFNTGQAYHINTTYDLYTVAMHEIGHALGLNESSVSGSVMYGTYTGAMKGLASDDIAGIRSIYSGNAARSPDAYNSSGNSDGSLSTAASINSLISSSSLTGLVQNLDISTAGQEEYFSFTAPAGSGSTMEISAQSSGLSLLAPEVTVYASNGSTVLATASGEGQYAGTTLTVSVPNVVAGTKYYVMVQGADSTQMGTGDYALGLNFKGATPPTEASPVVAVANGTPQHSGGGEADNSGPDAYAPANPSIVGISPDNGISSQDGITNNPRIEVFGTAPALDTVTVYCNGQMLGQTIALPNNTWTFNNTSDPLADGDYMFTAVATDVAGYQTVPSAGYEVVIDTHVPQPPVLGDISPDNGFSNTDGITDANHPTFSGTTEPFAMVSLYLNGSNQPFGATEADINGNWSYTVGQPGQVTYPGATLPSVVAPVVSLVDDLPVVGGLLGGLLGDLLGATQATGGSGPCIPDGTYKVTATAMDIAGTDSQASPPMTITIDTQQPQPPQVTGISPDTGKNNVTTAHNLTISGTAQANNLVGVLINGALVGAAMSGSNGAWTFDDTATTLPDGNYAITAVAMNVAGDVSNSSGAFNATIETVTPPAIAGASLITGTQGLPGNHQGLVVVGTAPPNDRVQVYLGANPLGSTNANGQGAWSYAYAPGTTTVAAGLYDFSSVAIDQFGNASSASPTFPLEVGGGPTAGTPQYASGILSGVATPGSLVSIVDGDLVIGVVTASASGNWQFTPNLSKGNHTIMVDAADSSGDTSLLSGPLTVNV